VFPPVGVPLSAGIEFANLIAANTDSVQPKVAKAAAKTVLRTAAAARKGDKDAARALKLIAKAKKARKKKNKKDKNTHIAFIITPAGRIQHDKSVK
jgi:hypothetical protein